MQKIAEILNKNFSSHAGVTEAELDAYIRSNLDELDRLVTELEQPRYRELIACAVAWQKMEQELDALRRALRERMTQKPSNKIDEFLNKLRKKT